MWKWSCNGALEKTPGEQPRIISDNGPQFIAKDFKVFMRIFGPVHVRTSPYYPQSNGKLERWHGSLKAESSVDRHHERSKKPKNVVAITCGITMKSGFTVAIDYVTPMDRLNGRAKAIVDRDRKLEAARESRRVKRQLANQSQQVAALAS